MLTSPPGGDQRERRWTTLQQAGCAQARKVLLLEEEIWTRSQAQCIHMSAKCCEVPSLSNVGIQKGAQMNGNFLYWMVGNTKEFLLC